MGRVSIRLSTILFFSISFLITCPTKLELCRVILDIGAQSRSVPDLLFFCAQDATNTIVRRWLQRQTTSGVLNMEFKIAKQAAFGKWKIRVVAYVSEEILCISFSNGLTHL